MSLIIHKSIGSMRAARMGCEGEVALVPTMGNLHDGHIALMREAAKEAPNVVASIFVNRIQFGPTEDFERYPRTFEADCEKLEAAGVGHVFAPLESEMYPQPQRYFVEPAPALAGVLEGASRPGHFRGVATVVLKLFNIVQPDVALFGKKDYQQWLVLQHMVQELSLPIRIVGGEIVRAPDGLALSSRNGYLSVPERSEAPRLQRMLSAVRDAVRGGRRDFAALQSEAADSLNRSGWQVDYLCIRRREDLTEPADDSDASGLVVLAAARLGSTRLIDNLEI